MKKATPFSSVTSFCVLAVTLLPFAVGEAAAATNHKADIKALAENDAKWNEDIAAKDAAKFAAHYTEGGVLILTGHEPIVGRAAIQAAFTGLSSDPAFALRFHASTVYLAKSGDIAYTQGPYTLDITDPTTKQVIHDHGTYVTTYRRMADGSWKATEDAVVSGVPPKPPASR